MNKERQKTGVLLSVGAFWMNCDDSVLWRGEERSGSTLLSVGGMRRFEWRKQVELIRVEEAGRVD